MKLVIDKAIAEDNNLAELIPMRNEIGKHLMEFDLINMPADRSLGEGWNGRVYDPVLARFLSPDPFVQFAGIPDGFNRYSYVMNNPLRFTDPSGYMTAGEALEKLKRLPNGGKWEDGDNDVTPYTRAQALAGLAMFFTLYDAGFIGGGGGSNEARSRLEVYLGAYFSPYNVVPVQFYGFDGHFFDYNKTTGEFYLPGTLSVINPFDVFTGKIDWFDNGEEKDSVEKERKRVSLLNPYNLSGEARLAMALATLSGPLTKLARYPDAVSIELNGSAGAVVSTNTTPIGVLIKQNKNIKGPLAQSYFQGSAGFGEVGASVNIVITEYYILGPNASQVDMDDFFGVFGSIDGSFDLLLSVGLGGSLSRPDKGSAIIGISYSIGLGVGAELNFTGGYMDFYSKYTK